MTVRQATKQAEGDRPGKADDERGGSVSLSSSASSSSSSSASEEKDEDEDEEIDGERTESALGGEDHRPTMAYRA